MNTFEPKFNPRTGTLWITYFYSNASPYLLFPWATPFSSIPLLFSSVVTHTQKSQNILFILVILKS